MLNAIKNYIDTPQHILMIKKGSLVAVKRDQVRLWTCLKAKLFGAGPASFKKVCEFINKNQEALMKDLQEGDEGRIILRKLEQKAQGYNKKCILCWKKTHLNLKFPTVKTPSKGATLQLLTKERQSDLEGRIRPYIELKMDLREIQKILRDDGCGDGEVEAVWKKMDHSTTPVPKQSQLQSKLAPKPPQLESIIVASGGVNQYSSGGPAACSYLAARFLASQVHPQTPQTLKALHDANKIHSDQAPLIDEEWIKQQKGIQLAARPSRWVAQREKDDNIELEAMNVMFGENDRYGWRFAIQCFAESDKIHGALITGNDITLAIRKCPDSAIEIFDSHGDNEITKKGNAAYIKRCHTQEDAVKFLAKKYTDIGMNPNIQVWPIQLQNA